MTDEIENVDTLPEAGEASAEDIAELEALEAAEAAEEEDDYTALGDPAVPEDWDEPAPEPVAPKPVGVHAHKGPFGSAGDTIVDNDSNEHQVRIGRGNGVVTTLDEVWLKAGEYRVVESDD